MPERYCCVTELDAGRLREREPDGLGGDADDVVVAVVGGDGHLRGGGIGGHVAAERDGVRGQVAGQRDDGEVGAVLQAGRCGCRVRALPVEVVVAVVGRELLRDIRTDVDGLAVLRDGLVEVDHRGGDLVEAVRRVLVGPDERAAVDEGDAGDRRDRDAHGAVALLGGLPRVVGRLLCHVIPFARL
jgi:hypothetical protein